MPTIYSSAKDESGKPYISVHDPDAEAKVGRWCAAPQVPDRCYRCFDPETLAHYPAEGYTEETNKGGVIWRHGTCHRCTPKS